MRNRCVRTLISFAAAGLCMQGQWLNRPDTPGIQTNKYVFGTEMPKLMLKLNQHCL